jgi:hypothetical protein
MCLTRCAPRCPPPQAIATGGQPGLFGGGGNTAVSNANAYGAMGANADSVAIAGRR